MEAGIATDAAPWGEDAKVTLDVQYFLNIKFPSTPPETTANSGAPSWLRKIVAAIKVAGNFLLAPAGGRVGPEYGRGNSVDREGRDAQDNSNRSQHSSLLGGLNGAARRTLDRARSSNMSPTFDVPGSTQQLTDCVL